MQSEAPKTEELVTAPTQVLRDPGSGKFMSTNSVKAKEQRREVKEKVMASVQDFVLSTGSLEIKDTDNQIVRQLKTLQQNIEQSSPKTGMQAAKSAELIQKLIGLFEDEVEEERGHSITVKFDLKDFYPEGLPPVGIGFENKTRLAQPTWAKDGETVNPDPNAEYIPEG